MMSGIKTINSLSGGKTSSYVAANHPADYDIFSLVRIEDNKSKFPDKKIRKEVEDRIKAPFIATAEDDMIIYTMLDLEQYIGREITWVTGNTFDQVIINKKSKGNTFLPSYMRRFCTTEMKTKPIASWIYNNLKSTPIMNFGFRSNEHSRAKRMIERQNENGNIEVKISIGKSKNGRNKWKTINYCKPNFPLIEDGVYKDQIEKYWKDKKVRFAWMNNCVGCFHKEPALLKKMWEKHPNKLEWFASKERESINNATWSDLFTYDQIKKWNTQFQLFDDDFNECDSGYCGI
jgi:hypothetical protein